MAILGDSLTITTIWGDQPAGNGRCKLPSVDGFEKNILQFNQTFKAMVLFKLVSWISAHVTPIQVIQAVTRIDPRSLEVTNKL